MHLEARGEHRRLIEFVEMWAEAGDPTPPARLAEIRSFLAVGMMDRAWSRLQELEAAGRYQVEVLTLTGRMFLARGWHARAMRPIQAALAVCPDDPELLDLANRAAARTAEAEPETDDTAALDDQLAQVRHHLTRGAFLKARRLLERLKQAHPAEPAVDDLLWVMRGHYTGGELDLAQMAMRWGPDVALSWELPEEAERTEAGAAPAPEVESGGFPSLFRAVGEGLHQVDFQVGHEAGRRHPEVVPHQDEGLHPPAAGEFEATLASAPRDWVSEVDAVRDDDDTQVAPVVKKRSDRPAPPVEAAPAVLGYEAEDDERILLTGGPGDDDRTMVTADDTAEVSAIREPTVTLPDASWQTLGDPRLQWWLFAAASVGALAFGAIFLLVVLQLLGLGLP